MRLGVGQEERGWVSHREWQTQQRGSQEFVGTLWPRAPHMAQILLWVGGILVAPHTLLHLGDSPPCSLKHGNSPSCKSWVLSAPDQTLPLPLGPTPPSHCCNGPGDVNGGVMGSAQRQASQSTVSRPELELTAPTDHPYASQHCKQGILPQSCLLSWRRREKLTISSALLEPSPTTHSSYPIQKRPPLFFSLGILGSSQEPQAVPVTVPHLCLRGHLPGS